MNFQICHLYRWEAIGPFIPIHTFIDAEPQTVVGAHKEQIRFHGVLHNAQSVAAHLFVIHNALESLTIVRCMENHRFPVIATIVIDNHKRLTGIFQRNLNLRHPTALRHSFDAGREVCPALAAIAGQLYIAIIRSYPDHILIDRAGRNRQDRREILRAGLIVGQATGLLAQFLFFFIISRQIRRNHFPGLTAVHTFV